MRGRTRNLLENVVAFVIFISILYGIYLIIINYTDIGKKLELVSPEKIIEKVEQKEKKIKEIIDEKILNDDEEENTFEIKPLKEKPIEVKKEKKVEQQAPKELRVEKVKPVVTEAKKVEKKQTVDITTKKESEKIIKKEPTPAKVEIKQSIQKTEELEEKKTEPKKPVLTDAYIKEKFALINSFLRGTKNQINEKVSKLTIAKTDKQRYANIRVTVLEDGGYERLTLMDGDKEYFEQISPAIISIFPITLDEKILDQFPRYFRMKIKED